MVSESEAEAQALLEYQRSCLYEAEREFLENDRVYKFVIYHRFVSKSKGWRKNEKGRRLRKRARAHWKSIRLVRYANGRFVDFDHAPLDEWATELLGTDEESRDGRYPSELLRSRIIEIWGY